MNWDAPITYRDGLIILMAVLFAKATGPFFYGLGQSLGDRFVRWARRSRR